MPPGIVCMFLPLMEDGKCVLDGSLPLSWEEGRTAAASSFYLGICMALVSSSLWSSLKFYVLIRWAWYLPVATDEAGQPLSVLQRWRVP